MNCDKYRSIPSVDLPDRKWPSAKISKAPIWCSVDLRDGNQALEVPMSLDQKVEFFKFLCEIGFKEIEIGFPAASETDFNFCRYLIDNDIIPDGVAALPKSIIENEDLQVYVKDFGKQPDV